MGLSTPLRHDAVLVAKRDDGFWEFARGGIRGRIAYAGARGDREHLFDRVAAAIPEFDLVAQ